MKDQNKTKKQLIEELAELRGKIAGLVDQKPESEQIWSPGTVSGAINMVLLETLKCETEEEVARMCLSVAEKLTDSKFGFIGEINKAGLFDTIAISDPGWDKCIIPESHAIVMINGMEIRGLWSAAIRHKKSIIANDPMFHPESMGIPEGHPPLTSFMGIPLEYSGKIIGVIALANKKTGYTPKDQSAVEKLSVAFIEALMRKRTDEELTEYRERLEELVDRRTAQLTATNKRLRQEIKEREHAKEAMRRETAKLQSMISSMQEGVVFADASDKVIEVNPYFSKLMETDRSELIGKSIWDLHQGEVSEKLREHIRQFKEKPDSPTVIIQRALGDAQVIMRLQPICRDDKYDGVLLNVIDVTEMVNARRAAEAASRTKSEFLANMSHELRTPLNAIIGFAEILRDGICGELNEDQMSAVLDIHESGKHLLRMINDVLDLSKVEAGKMELIPEFFSIYDAVKGIQSIVRDMANRKNLNLNASIPEDLPEVYADQVKFKQIMYNLLSNAVKFTPDGGSIDIEAKSDGEEFLVCVTDTGVGIEPEDQKEIFDEFRQVDSATTRQYEGTGLGLALTKRLVELHGGRIWVESEGAGKGSKFCFTLPARRPESDDTRVPPDLPEAHPKTVDRQNSAVHPQGKTILVVEDNNQASQLLCIYLNESGYNTVVARDGEEAVRLAREVKPFAITMDIMLPKKDGWQVMQELNTFQDTRDIPVIIISIVDDQSFGFSMGAVGYLVKPIDRHQLASVLQKLESAGVTPRILVVDDNAEDLKLMSTILQSQGYETIEASDGVKGVAKAIQEHPDLIILDLLMPGMSGFDVVRTLRHHPQAQNIPIIICTAKELTNEDREALNSKVKSVIQKGDEAKIHLLDALHRMEEFYAG